MATIETPTKIGIISRALLLLGEKAASSLSEDRYGVTVGANLFEQTYEAELQSNRWRFAMRKNSLSRVNTTPENEWQYVFALPSDCLLPIGAYPPVDYEIYGARVYTNSPTIEMDYMFKPNISEVPPYFAQLLQYRLALDMAGSVTESQAAVQRMERLYTEQRDRALYADAQGRPNRRMWSSPFKAVR